MERRITFSSIPPGVGSVRRRTYRLRNRRKRRPQECKRNEKRQNCCFDLYTWIHTFFEISIVHELQRYECSRQPVDQLLRARACAPDASVPTVRRNHLFPPTKEKNPERFRKNEKSSKTTDLKLARLPPLSPLPVAAFPSASRDPGAPLADAADEGE